MPTPFAPSLVGSMPVQSVLYANDMQPITVLELSANALEFLRKHGRVSLDVATPMLEPCEGTAPPPPKLFHVDQMRDKPRPSQLVAQRLGGKAV